MTETLRRCSTMPVRALLMTALAACGGSADARPTNPASQDTPPPPVAEAPAPPVRAAAETPAQPAARPAECAVRCIAAEGALAVDEDAAQQVADSLGGVFDGFRACMHQAGIRRSYSPMVTLRFDSTGRSSAVGVDTAGYESGEPCFTNAVLGSAYGISVAGPAVVRCSERCGQPRHKSVRR